MRKWKSVELTKELAGRFKEVLRDYHIKAEPSACYNLVHFECFVNESETELLNNWLKNA